MPTIIKQMHLLNQNLFSPFFLGKNHTLPIENISHSGCKNLRFLSLQVKTNFYIYLMCRKRIRKYNTNMGPSTTTNHVNWGGAELGGYSAPNLMGLWYGVFF